MKQLILIMLIIVLIPYMIVTFMVKENKKQVNNEINVRVKKEDNSIITVPFEEYIIGVLAGEMPAKFEMEALKAQAVAARSYVLKKMDKKNDYDVLDTVMNQVYLDNNKLKEKWGNNFQEYYNKLSKAVMDTKGEYLVYNGEIVEAFFFSTSVGKTENVEEVFSESLPYLRSVDSMWDSEVSPVFNETNTISLNDFYSKLGLEYNSDLNIEVIETTSTGRIKKIKINNIEFNGNDVSKKLNLRSNFFEITKLNDNVLITTKGYGHGVGMSQYGAQAMALKNYKYDEILKYYYQNVEIVKM